MATDESHVQSTRRGATVRFFPFFFFFFPHSLPLARSIAAAEYLFCGTHGQRRCFLSSPSPLVRSSLSFSPSSIRGRSRASRLSLLHLFIGPLYYLQFGARSREGNFILVFCLLPHPSATLLLLWPSLCSTSSSTCCSSCFLLSFFLFFLPFFPSLSFSLSLSLSPSHAPTRETSYVVMLVPPSGYTIYEMFESTRGNCTRATTPRIRRRFRESGKDQRCSWILKRGTESLFSDCRNLANEREFVN